MAEIVLVTCEYENCNNEFRTRVVNNKPLKRFCSRRCKGKAQPPSQKCRAAATTPELNDAKSRRMRGAKNPMWRGGDSDKERRNRSYKKWRIAVFKRDKYICQECGYYNGDGQKRRDLNAHHIVHWIESIELRYAVDNGITLCVPCHIKKHTDKD